MNIKINNAPDGFTEEEAERWNGAVLEKVAQIMLKNSESPPDTEVKGPVRYADIEIEVVTSGAVDPEIEGFTITTTFQDTGEQRCEVLGPDGDIIKVSIPPRLSQ